MLTSVFSKKIHMFVLLCIFVAPGFTAPGVYAGGFRTGKQAEHDVTVRLHGKFNASSCDVEIPGGIQNISIGNFFTEDFPTTGSTSIFKPFNINLTNCSATVKGLKVKFTGDADKDNVALLALSNTDGGTASGIGIEILDQNQKPVSINNSDSEVYQLQPDKNTVPFYVRFKSTNNNVTAGSATATMYFDLQYQ
jgi:type 1 fimbria pilin